MNDFVQLHLLTNYPAANLNRDDLGRPKTVVIGGAERLRISSQSLKRAWRTSDVFQQAFAGHLGVRTKDMGVTVYRALISGVSLEQAMAGDVPDAPTFPPVAENLARKTAEEIAGVFGKRKSPKKSAENELRDLEVEQLVHFSPEELQNVSGLLQKVRSSGKPPASDDLNLLRKTSSAVDIAMFGRMLAAHPEFNADAAVQVAHAFSVQKVAVEDDFFTAVDDLNRGEEDRGAGHMGITEFGSGLFYLYLCIDRKLLVSNLGGDEESAKNSLRALAEAAATVSPTGKQNSFASRAHASYLLAEKGSFQPRSLAVAFLKPISTTDMLESSVHELEHVRQNMNNVYGQETDSACFNAHAGTGTLQDVMQFIME